MLLSVDCWELFSSLFCAWQFWVLVCAVWFITVSHDLYALITADYEKSDFHDVFMFLDRLANVLAGGRWHATISARVGYFSTEAVWIKWYRYWNFLRRVIDWAFFPLDGADHCKKALRWERRRWRDDYNNYQRGPAITLAFLCLLVLVSCAAIGLALRLWRLVRIWRGRTDDANASR